MSSIKGKCRNCKHNVIPKEEKEFATLCRWSTTAKGPWMSCFKYVYENGYPIYKFEDASSHTGNKYANYSYVLGEEDEEVCCEDNTGRGK
jgi:hypothetical protein